MVSEKKLFVSQIGTQRCVSSFFEYMFSEYSMPFEYEFYLCSIVLHCVRIVIQKVYLLLLECDVARSSQRR